ncbi:membrane integrity-associated transporter subunit PqiC [Desulforhabdus sp. TSK]|uniref:PqiC family protein n=1 Tax=Desulforhabdus sp. TSK TaxID=2925014 RepID=UPI001FC859BE|nr:PqiC family protein [Desulforhabdus sp. TSK]GKT09719.1 hypothetical protein DSTSK_30240 [Desulforhabdus sp. TSK]
MMRRPWTTDCCRTLLLGALLWGILAGCSTSPPPRLYTLSPMESMTSGQEGASPSIFPSGEITLGIGPVRIPEYLDRKQVVSRSTENRIDISEFDLWGGTLRDEITRVLTENIGSMLPSAKVYGFPWLTGGRMDYRIPVNVLQFDGSFAGQVILRAQWTLQSGDGKRLFLAGNSHIVEPLHGAGYSALVAAHNRALACLSQEIVSGVASLPPATDP